MLEVGSLCVTKGSKLDNDDITWYLYATLDDLKASFQTRTPPYFNPKRIPLKSGVPVIFLELQLIKEVTRHADWVKVITSKGVGWIVFDAISPILKS